jgi:hypothetical protein
MITFHPAVRLVSSGYLAMVTLRRDRGRMVGSKVSQVSQGGNVFTTAEEALAHALRAAERVVAKHADITRLSAAAV